MQALFVKYCNASVTPKTCPSVAIRLASDYAYRNSERPKMNTGYHAKPAYAGWQGRAPMNKPEVFRLYDSRSPRRYHVLFIWDASEGEPNAGLPIDPASQQYFRTAIYKKSRSFNEPILNCNELKAI
jgi:hypothetical protein